MMVMLTQLVSCEVEFSPNADWKEVPVVYCVLNPDDDTSYVRVQKCFLSDNNLNDYVTISDSMNYPEGELTVKLLEWKARKLANNVLVKEGSKPVDSLLFQYELKDKEEGLFDYPYQPIYACKTRNKLDTNCIYQLVVLKSATSDTLAHAETSLLGGTSKIDMINGFRPGANNFLFKFVQKGKCTLTWKTWTRGRLYQPRVRFYYKQDGEVRHVDVRCNEVTNSGKQSTLSSTISQGAYFTDIKNALKNDPSPKSFIHHVDITIDACEENLNAYLASIRAINSGSQSTQVYTNIENGIGVFSARRSITVSVPSDSAAGVGTYMAMLKDLNVGF